MNRTVSPLSSENDLESLLPKNPVREYPPKQVIYGPGLPCDHLYLVLSGRVAVANAFNDIAPVTTRIVGSDGIFGELSLIGCADSSESSRTIDKVKLLAWSHTEVDQQLRRNPQLAWILIRYFVQRCAELNARLENIAFRKTSHRVILGLLQLADSLGKPSDFGYRLGPLTHQMIAEYVGTSREIVTANMTGLRRAGLLRYSRKQIEVSTAAMDRALREGGITPNPVETPLVRAASSSGTASLRA